MCGYRFYRSVRRYTGMAAAMLMLVAAPAAAQNSGRTAQGMTGFYTEDEATGRVAISQIWSQQLRFPMQLSRGLINLMEAVNRWTGIRASMESHVYIGTPGFERLPFAYITTGESFELSSNELASIGKFFENGGFMVLETATPSQQNSQAGAAMKQMVKNAGGSRVRFAPIPNDHELYHSFFDFEDGPPLGSEIAPAGRTIMNQPVNYLEGIWYKGRLAGLYSDKGYILNWSKPFSGEGTSQPMLKMGVNFIVYALKNDPGEAGSR